MGACARDNRGALRRVPQHLPEVDVGVRGLHLPQRPPEPGPQLLQMHHVRGDRPVLQPRRRPCQHETGQHETGQHVDLQRFQVLDRPEKESLVQGL